MNAFMDAADTPLRRLARVDAAAIAAGLDEEGAAVLSGMFDAAQCRSLAALDDASGVRASFATRPAEGRMVALADPLPGWLVAWRSALIGMTRPIAQRWHEALAAGDDAATSHDADVVGMPGDAIEGSCTLLRLEQADRLSLRHGPNDDAPAHSLRVVVLLSDPGQQFTGGEFVMTEQRPRMQSRPMVLPLRQGDAAIIACAGRPVRGARGLYRVVMKHGVSPLRTGTRWSLDIPLR